MAIQSRKKNKIAQGEEKLRPARDACVRGLVKDTEQTKAAGPGEHSGVDAKSSGFKRHRLKRYAGRGSCWTQTGGF